MESKCDLCFYQAKVIPKCRVNFNVGVVCVLVLVNFESIVISTARIGREIWEDCLRRQVWDSQPGVYVTTG